MGKITEVQAANAVAATETEKKKKELIGLINTMQPAIKKALPTVITPERFTRMVLSAISSNEQLQKCEKNSFLGAMMQAAQLGVEPNTPLGQAYILPYYDHGTLKAQFELGYKGLIDLAYRSGEVSIIDAQVVYANDDFDYELGLEPKLKHKPALSNRGKPILYYAMFRTKSGGFGFQVMSYEDCQEHAKKYSKAVQKGTSSPWNSNFDEMAKKTVLKKALKYAPLKSDYARQLTTDGTVKSTLDPDMFDVPNEVSWDNAGLVEVDQETGEVLNAPDEGAITAER